MAFFFWSVHGETLFLARQLQTEGESVQLYCKSPAARFVGRGIVPTLPRSQVNPGDTVIFDAVGMGTQGQALRRQGWSVIGGNPFDRALELDRTQGTTIMQELGIAVPETHTFTKIPDAMRFLREQEGTWFFKPSGNQATGLTGSDSTEEMVRYLAWIQGRGGEIPTSFELQREVEGCEVSCEGWFDGQRFVPPFNGTFEDKKFLTGNLGPNTGCEANVVWVWPDDAPLPEETIDRLGERLRAERYVGPIDLNMIVDQAGEPHGLEWSARTGFDALQAYTQLLKPPVGEQLKAFAEGRLDRWSFLDEPLALTLRVTVPPYPVEDEQASAEVRGLPLDPAIMDDPHLLIDDVMMISTGPALAGRNGGVVVIAAVGDDMDELRARVLQKADGLSIRSAQYRTDPVKRAERDWAALRDAGYGGPAL